MLWGAHRLRGDVEFFFCLESPDPEKWYDQIWNWNETPCILAGIYLVQSVGVHDRCWVVEARSTHHWSVHVPFKRVIRGHGCIKLPLTWIPSLPYHFLSLHSSLFPSFSLLFHFPIPFSFSPLPSLPFPFSSIPFPFFHLPFTSSPLDFLPFLFGPSLLLSTTFLFHFSPCHSKTQIFVHTN